MADGHFTNLLRAGSALVTSVGCWFLLVQQRTAAAAASRARTAQRRRGAPFGVLRDSHDPRRVARHVPLVLPAFVTLIRFCAALAPVTAALTWWLEFGDFSGESGASTAIAIRVSLHVSSCAAVVLLQYLFSLNSIGYHALRRSCGASSTAAVATLVLDITSFHLLADWNSAQSVALTEGLLYTLMACFSVYLLVRAARRSSLLPLGLLLSVTSFLRGTAALGAATTMTFAPDRGPVILTPLFNTFVIVDIVGASALHLLFPWCLFAVLRRDTLYWRGVGHTAANARNIKISDEGISALQPLLGGQAPITWIAATPRRGRGIASFSKSMRFTEGCVGATARSTSASPPAGEPSDVGAQTRTARQSPPPGDSDFSEAKSARDSGDTRSAHEEEPLHWVDWEEVEITTEHVLGRGSGGIVYRGVYNGEPVAVKLVSPVDLTEVDVEEFIAEAIWTRSLQHERSVQIFGLLLRPPELGMILGICERGSLRRLLRQRWVLGAGDQAARPTAASVGDWFARAATGTMSLLSRGTAARNTGSVASSSNSGHRMAALSRAASLLLPGDGAWTWDRVLDLCLQCAECVALLHSYRPHPVVHRDIKSSNFLVTSDWVVKLSDFGLSRLVVDEERGPRVSSSSVVHKSDTSTSSFDPATPGDATDGDAWMTGLRGSALWMAPEVITAKEGQLCRYGPPADVFSLGVVLWEVMSGCEPYEGLSSAVVLARVSRGEIRPTVPAWCPADFADVLRKCWAQSPGDRLSAAAVVDALKACRGGDWLVPSGPSALEEPAVLPVRTASDADSVLVAPHLPLSRPSYGSSSSARTASLRSEVARPAAGVAS